MVDLLAMAHDRNCEADLAAQIEEDLRQNRLPDTTALRTLFGPRADSLPGVEVQLASLSSYDRLEVFGEIASVGKTPEAKLVCDQSREFGLAALVMGEPEQIHHAPAGVPLRQSVGQRCPGIGILGAGKEPVAIDRSRQRLRFASQGMDDMPVVDAIDALSIVTLTQAGMADGMGSPEPCLDTVVIDVDPEPLADQARGRTVEDAMHEKATGRG